MVFNISAATSQSSLNQLFQSYFNTWSSYTPSYSIVSLYNLWYYTNTLNNNVVQCRMYYQYMKNNSTTTGYWCAYANYDTTTGLYTYVFGSGVIATSTNNGLSFDQLSQLTIYYSISNICFPAGTPITVDQGVVAIENINPAIHTIRRKHIYGVSKTTSQYTYLVCLEKNALGTNSPNKRTLISPLHKIMHKNKWVMAKDLLGLNKSKIKQVAYNGEPLYNVIMQTHESMLVNNMIAETLHPSNPIAKPFIKNV
jgi:hypothetical protein